jgi:hypothetical protein
MLQRARIDRVQRLRLVWLAIFCLRKKSPLPQISVSGSGYGCARNAQ